MIPYHPWSTVQSLDPNATLLKKYQQGVLMYIMTHPGVTLVSVYIPPSINQLTSCV